ncbi:serine hydrolase domain-containing protein [Microlunatus parietis]|uniref:CubicO group peptidase (Beta-lactamase class C family) n=1 Tax=Microlunatus parietis TaxID=682979 RepID=A0A7Y9LEX7_9ACTN|nr:serine hydrolase domain-containing protein [Microlunatus parietis]NYE74278.1 CubicO group peptidase (beta-lactamase class C family) [Microlunatus parietis]
MTQQLERASAAEHGLRPRAVLDFLDDLDQELHSLMIIRHGKVLAEGWWAPYGPEQVHLIYSLSKSFTATAAGIAVAEGKLHLDLPLLAYLDDLADSAAGDRIRKLTVRDTLRMATGHLEDTLWRSFVADPHEPLRGFLGIEPDHEPGSVFAYNNTATYAIAAITQRVTGETLLDYLTPRLLKPLGIDQAHWTAYPEGRQLGYTGLHLTTESIGKFGELYLRRGRWGDRQLVPAAYVDEATSALTPNQQGSTPDWQQGYGFQFWRSRYGYRADGAFGQFCLVLPDQDAVIVMTSAAFDAQSILATVWQHLLPGFSQRPLSGADRDADALAERLATLTLPTADQAADAAAEQPYGRPPEAEDAPRPDVHVTGVESGDYGVWRVSLTHSDPMLPPETPYFDLVAAADRWLETTVELPGDRELRLAASGTWLDDIFRLDLVLVQTPHRMTLWYAPSTGGTITEWVTAPLPGTSLFGLALPRALTL